MIDQPDSTISDSMRRELAGCHRRAQTGAETLGRANSYTVKFYGVEKS